MSHLQCTISTPQGAFLAWYSSLMVLANSNTIICHLLPGPHLYTWVESSNVDKLPCWRTKVPRRWWDSNPGSSVRVEWILHYTTTPVNAIVFASALQLIHYGWAFASEQLLIFINMAHYYDEITKQQHLTCRERGWCQQPPLPAPWGTPHWPGAAGAWLGAAPVTCLLSYWLGTEVKLRALHVHVWLYIKHISVIWKNIPTGFLNKNYTFDHELQLVTSYIVIMI